MNEERFRVRVDLLDALVGLKRMHQVKVADQGTLFRVRTAEASSRTLERDRGLRGVNGIGSEGFKDSLELRVKRLAFRCPVRHVQSNQVLLQLVASFRVPVFRGVRREGAA